MIQELVKVVPEIFNPMKDGSSPEYAKEQVPKDPSGFPRLLINDLTLSISSWLRLLNSYGADPPYGPAAMWTCPLFCS